MSIDSLLRGLLVLVALVVLGGLALRCESYQNVTDTRELIDHARVVQAEIDAVGQRVVELEMRVRGHALTGDAARATGITEAAAALQASVDRLAALFEDNPVQVERLAHLRRFIAAEIEGARAAVQAPRGADSLDPGLAAREAEVTSIQELLAVLRGEESNLLEVRRAAAKRGIGRMSAVGVISLCVLVAFVLAMYVLIRRQLAAQRASVAELNRSERFLAAVVENLPNMVFVKEAGELRFQQFNRAGEELLGESRANLLGKNDYDFFPAEQADFFTEKDRQTLAGRVVVDIPEEPIETKAGRRWLHTRKVPILDAHGRPAYLLGISDDITEQKQQTEALRHARDEAESASRELEAFAYAVAHDLRAPLRAINGFTVAVLEDHGPALPPEAIELLDRVRAASRRMGDIIDALLALSRLTRVDLKREDVDLSATIGSITSELARQHAGRTVEVAIEPGLRVHADPRLLRQALINLVDNAWKYTARTPEAKVEAGRLPGAEPVFFVRDNGAGFDMAHQDKLFMPFQRLHAASEFEGHGIGLVTAARVFTRHGGRIWAESAVGQGATFFFVLPEVAT